MFESARMDTLNPKEAESSQYALKLVGNASAHLSTEKQCKISHILIMSTSNQTSPVYREHYRGGDTVTPAEAGHLTQ